MKTFEITVNSKELDDMIAALRRYKAQVYHDCSHAEYEEICQLIKKLDNIK